MPGIGVLIDQKLKLTQAGILINDNDIYCQRFDKYTHRREFSIIGAADKRRIGIYNRMNSQSAHS